MQKIETIKIAKLFSDAEKMRLELQHEMADYSKLKSKLEYYKANYKKEKRKVMRQWQKIDSRLSGSEDDEEELEYV